MNLVKFMNNLIFKINSQHLLKNGAGKAQRTLFNGTGGETPTFLSVLIEGFIGRITDIANYLIRIVFQLLYFVIKLALNIMDFLMVIVSELSGQAQAFDMAKANSNLESSDIIFRFFLNSVTMKILKRVFIFSILVLILVSIIAIVKNEWQRATDDKARDAKVIIVKSLKSLLMMFITPFVVIVGIIFSNVVLTSAINSLNGGKSFFSLGSVVFMSSTYNANWYRIYADNNDKIPILFDYNGGFYNADNGDIDFAGGQFNLDDQMAELRANEYLTSGYSTYSMFKNQAYFEFDQVPENSTYYSFYDGEHLKTSRIEYYVMADFIDYAMETGQEFYIKNVEDVFNIAYDACEEALDNGLELYPYVEGGKASLQIDEDFEIYYYRLAQIFNNIVPYERLDGSDGLVAKSIFKNIDDEMVLDFEDDNIESYKFNVYYDGYLLNSCGDMGTIEPEVVEGPGGEQVTVYPETAVTYEAFSGADDEAYGAKYVYCYKMSIPLNEDQTQFTTIFVPVFQNSNNNSYFKFNSDYLSDASEDRPYESMFLARGGFDTTGFPTAIKSYGNDIVFYRHDCDSVGLFKAKPQLSYVQTDENTGNQEVIEAEGDFFSRVLGFDQDNVRLALDIKMDTMPTFTKTVFDVTTFDDGLYKLNYSFVGTNLRLANVYDTLNINFAILTFASWKMMSTFFFLIFALLRRLLELTVFWFTYPAWLASFPLDSNDNITEGTTFAMWRSNFIDRVLAVYTTYIGLVLFFVLVPVIVGIDFAVTIVGSISPESWLAYIPPTFIAWVIRTMFVLVLFTMVERINEIINDLVGGGRLSNFDASGKDTFDDSIKTVKLGYSTFSIRENFKKAKGAVADGVQTGLNLIPGKAFIDEGATAVRHISNNSKHAKAVKALVSTSLSGATDAKTEIAKAGFEKLTKRHSDGNPKKDESAGFKNIEERASKSGRIV